MEVANAPPTRTSSSLSELSLEPLDFFATGHVHRLFKAPSHSATFHYVLIKFCGRSKNLYIVVGTQYKPIRTWYGLHERGGRGGILDMFKKTQ